MFLKIFELFHQEFVQHSSNYNRLVWTTISITYINNKFLKLKPYKQNGWGCNFPCWSGCWGSWWMCCTGSLGEEQEVQVFLSMSLQVKFIIVVMYEAKLYFPGLLRYIHTATGRFVPTRCSPCAPVRRRMSARLEWWTSWRRWWTWWKRGPRTWWLRRISRLNLMKTHESKSIIKYRQGTVKIVCNLCSMWSL